MPLPPRRHARRHYRPRDVRAAPSRWWRERRVWIIALTASFRSASLPSTIGKGATWTAGDQNQDPRIVEVGWPALSQYSDDSTTGQVAWHRHGYRSIVARCNRERQTNAPKREPRIAYDTPPRREPHNEPTAALPPTNATHPIWKTASG